MASGDTLLALSPLASEPPATLYATIDTRNNHPVLDFDAATDESTYFSAVLPRNYSGNGLTVRLHWMATSAITGDVIWAAAFERMSDGATDLDANSFAAAKASTAVTVPGTSGVALVTSIVFTGAEIDGLVAGDSFRLEVSRDADNVADTALGDAELLMVEVQET